MEQSEFICKDHLVSGEKYRLEKLPNYDILKTSPVPEDLDRYYKSEEYISHTDSAETLTDKIYKSVKTYMLQKKVGWLLKEKAEGSLLDIGAGTGDFLKAASRYYKTEGVEPNKKARAKSLEKGKQLYADTSEILNQQFSIISMWHVLEHVPDLENQFLEFNRLLEKDGMLVIAVPNYKSKDANVYKEDWAAYDVPRHIWHFSKKGIEQLFSDNGYKLIKTEGLKFDSFYVSLLSEKHKTKKVHLIKAFWNGLSSNISALNTGEYSSMVYFFKKQ
ncbi:class I SAM-dependent methyltransferase [Zunongwangia sp.]|uniref:class I SAM-dependent methyltransferase n=1 Tax=Zunongwangia sp. TaxID=1965325 RepID=UPI003AA81551